MKPGQFPAVPLFWEIAYVGGKRVRGETREDWINAPAEGVLVVRQPVDRTYQRLGVPTHFTIRVASVDYYWLREDGTIDGGNAREAPRVAATVKRGGWAEREEFLRVYNEFLADVVA